MSTPPQVNVARRRIRTDLSFIAALCVALSIAAAVQSGVSAASPVRATVMVGLAVCFAVAAVLLHLRRDRSAHAGAVA